MLDVIGFTESMKQEDFKWYVDNFNENALRSLCISLFEKIKELYSTNDDLMKSYDILYEEQKK